MYKHSLINESYGSLDDIILQTLLKLKIQSFCDPIVS
jgi:hypothetical protein